MSRIVALQEKNDGLVKANHALQEENEGLRKHAMDMQKNNDRNPFTLVLIDGDGMNVCLLFNNMSIFLDVSRAADQVV